MHVVRRALELGILRASVFTARSAGGSDHMLANLQVASYAAGARSAGEAIQPRLRGVHLLRGERPHPGARGLLAVGLPLSDRCTGVEHHSVKIRSSTRRYQPASPIGTSNEWRGEAHISLESGIMGALAG